VQSICDESERAEQAAPYDLDQHHDAAKHNDRPRLALVLLVTCTEKHVVVAHEEGIGFVHWFAARSRHRLFEITPYYIKQLSAHRRVGWRVAEVLFDVILQHNGKQSIHGAAAARDSLYDIGALHFGFKCALDRLDLSTNAANPVQQLGFFTSGMAHSFL
jgi:hypothetical protein